VSGGAQFPPQQRERPGTTGRMEPRPREVLAPVAGETLPG
jgi:hypothetical protein